MSQFIASGGQSIEASASALVLSMNVQSFISFWIDWFDLLAVQGTLSLLQQHSSKDKDHGIWSHYFMANIRGKSGNSDKFYFLGLPNHCG